MIKTAKMKAKTPKESIFKELLSKQRYKQTVFLISSFFSQNGIKKQVSLVPSNPFSYSHVVLTCRLFVQISPQNSGEDHKTNIKSKTPKFE